MTLFLTDLDRDKVTIRRSRMGRNAVTSNELFIDDLIVPVADRVGEEGKGSASARRPQPESGC